jgi:outer membrane protein TolC
MTAAVGQVRALLAEWDLLASQYAKARHELAPAQHAADQARAALAHSIIDERTAVDLITTSLTKEQEIMNLELAMLDRQIAIQTLVGAGLPVIDLPPEPAKGRQP